MSVVAKIYANKFCSRARLAFAFTLRKEIGRLLGHRFYELDILNDKYHLLIVLFPCPSLLLAEHSVFRMECETRS